MTSETADADTWLARFHAGDRETLELCYLDHFETVERAVARILPGTADRETVVHEVFFRLLSSESHRLAFSGGSFSAWLTAVARNRAVDFVRHHARERCTGLSVETGLVDPTCAVEARLLIDRFRREVLPERWQGVFQARFIDELSQEEAAAKLRLGRTTLAYREARVRALLKRFLRRVELS